MKLNREYWSLTKTVTYGTCSVPKSCSIGFTYGSPNPGEILVKRLESQEGELRIIASDDENFDH
ncbi:MAG: hypothetical protein IIA06_07195 [Proteobacteria bacterium]|nr:hypothetical protein [Pseudomonadota bacterium]